LKRLTRVYATEKEIMRKFTKFGLAAGAILVASIGFANLGQAAPLAGLNAAGSAVKMTENSSTIAEATAEKAHYLHHPRHDARRRARHHHRMHHQNLHRYNRR